MKVKLGEDPLRMDKLNAGISKGRGTAGGHFNCTPSPTLRKREVFITIDSLLESLVRTLQALSPRSRELVAIMVNQLAEQEGITIPKGPSQVLNKPADGIPLWIAKLKQESFARKTIELYTLTVRSYLEHDPFPTKLSIQQWLADRLEHVSTSRVSNDRKALRSFFSFLYSEGQWPTDPTHGLKPIRVRYRARELPETGDIQRLLQYRCYRERDTAKFRTMLILLITTGLRVSEAAGILKRNISFSTNEVKVIGKGDKEGVVPVLPMMAEVLKRYIDEYSDNSAYLFPGDTELGYWSVSSFEKTLVRACLKLGIEKITPHQLRHYFATHALRGGAKLEVVSKILRHASVAVTADIYRHVLTQEMHETAERYAPLSQIYSTLPEGTDARTDSTDHK